MPELEVRPMEEADLDGESVVQVGVHWNDDLVLIGDVYANGLSLYWEAETSYENFCEGLNHIIRGFKTVRFQRFKNELTIFYTDAITKVTKRQRYEAKKDWRYFVSKYVPENIDYGEISFCNWTNEVFEFWGEINDSSRQGTTLGLLMKENLAWAVPNLVSEFHKRKKETKYSELTKQGLDKVVLDIYNGKYGRGTYVLSSNVRQ